MKVFLHLAFAISLFAAGIASESHGSDLLRISEDGWYSWQVEGGAQLEIHARIEAGRPMEFYIPVLQCRREEPPASTYLGKIAAQDSLAWLRRFISPPTEASVDVMAAISAHNSEAAVRVLEDVIRHDDNARNRKEAVFWLGQIEDDAAFELLDALISRGSLAHTG